jgi:soluble lytic murein transglycosylase-like protein
MTSLLLRRVGIVLPWLWLASAPYFSFHFPIKQDPFGHAWAGHIPDRARAYWYLLSAPRRARVNAELGVEEIDRLIDAIGARHAVDPALIRAVVTYESGYLANTITTTGAMGLMALMPGTARHLGVRDPFDPAENLDGGTRLLAELAARFDNSVALVLAGYNAGQDAVVEARGIPSYRETQDYVRHVKRLYLMYRAVASTSSVTGRPDPSSASLRLRAKDAG